ncbi:hypothetical protein [Phreatobacter cathodiphilus]|uniref:Uncharacterized protein n=1 Tax=Phreatobacter cathodiphilus TaxID=1868589 RepID=A0A2S0N9F0_9HYPH|nr:hypothetical protein [Phreatobacter cathodiphilus]AVO44736.1 hypothetical protein C6569_06505 [Phreatobacter cathodiphilus]
MSKTRDLTGTDDKTLDDQAHWDVARRGQKPAGGASQATDQPAGVPDRTRKPDEAQPRDVDEGDGRSGN